MEQSIQPIHEVLYIESLLSIVMTIQVEEGVISSILEEINKGNRENVKLLIASAQNIVTQTALLSKYFKPPTSNDVSLSRGRFLSKVYDIKAGNILLKREVRDHIEHFDEKLDKYLSDFPVGNFKPQYVGPRTNEELTTFFRAYFTDEAVFKVLGKEVKLMPISEEVERLRIQLEEEAKTGRFLRK